MPTHNIAVTDKQESLIESLVGSGRFRNAGEVLREGLELVERREAEDAEKIEALRAAAKVGDDAFERGEYRSFPDAASAIAHLRAALGQTLRDPTRR